MVTIVLLPTHLARCLEDHSRTSWTSFCKTSWRSFGRRKIVTLNTFSRLPQDKFWRLFKTSWRPTNICWVINWFNSIKNANEPICKPSKLYYHPGQNLLEQIKSYPSGTLPSPLQTTLLVCAKGSQHCQWGLRRL